MVGAWVAGTVEPIHDERPGRVAAVDQGTNSTRLLVAEPDEGGGFEELARDMVITRLGSGRRRDRQARPRGPPAHARGDRPVRPAGAGAPRRTDPCRRDGRGAGCRERGGVRTPGARARRIRARDRQRGGGGAALVPRRHPGLDAPPPFLVLDIGGGSTEFVLGSERPIGRDLDADGERPADRALRPRRPAGGRRPGPDASGRRRAAGRCRARDPGRRCANVRRGGRDVDDRAGDRARARVLRPRTDPPHPPLAGRRRAGVLAAGRDDDRRTGGTPGDGARVAPT